HLLRSGGRDELVLETPAHSHRCVIRDGLPWISLPVWTGCEVPQGLLHALLHRAGVHAETVVCFPNGVWLAVAADRRELENFSREAFPWHLLDRLSPGALIL